MNNLPMNILTERTVLMACVFSYDNLEHVINDLETTDFSDFTHRYIFKIIKEMCQNKTPVCFDSLMKELSIKKEIESVKCAMDFYDENLDPSYIQEKIEELKSMSLHRNMIQRCELGRAHFLEQKSVTKDQCSQWVNEISSMIYSSSKESSYRTVCDILKNYDPESGMSFIECLQKRQEAFKKGIPIEIGLPTHYKDIDAIYDGFKPGHLVIVGARPGVGKTTFMCNVILNNILKSNCAMGVMSLEMENTEITEKLALIHSEVDAKKFKEGSIDWQDFQKIVSCSRKIEESQVFIDHTAGININLLYSRAKHWKNTKNIKILFIDYLQLIKGSGKPNSKYEEITAISQTLKKIAKDLKICVVSLAQLNRESAKSGKPVVSDLRDSGSIEQDADAIFLLNDPSVLEPSNRETLEVYLAKNRFGGTGLIKLHFNKPLSKISNFQINLANIGKEWESLSP